jgi:hypothetical protein
LRPFAEVLYDWSRTFLIKVIEIKMGETLGIPLTEGSGAVNHFALITISSPFQK